MFITVIIFVLILLALVLVHEWGHFFSARRLGIGVEEFGFGFPPRLASINHRGTKFSFNWLPLGGFVRLKGESGENKNDPDSFANQKPWRRAIVLVAGVVMNMVLAFFLLSIGFMVGVPVSLTEAEVTRAKDVKIQIAYVSPDSPAALAGLKPGDTIISLDGASFSALADLQNYIGHQTNRQIDLVYERLGVTQTLSVQPQELPEIADRAVIGVSLVQTGVLTYSWYESIWHGAKSTYFLTKEILLAFAGLFKGLIISRQVPTDLSGPVGIAVLTGQVVDMGIAYVIQFAALLSINLALINILPFPALDGGRVLFLIIEKIRRKPTDTKVEALVHNLGFAFLMILVVLITYRDIVRLGSGFFDNILGS